MSEVKTQGKYVFGLDIGTRSIVGTVGYREGDIFYVVAQEIREHETRAMIDGQIHDIGQVGHTIAEVKRALEEKISVKLTDVCIAAAGRVLRTVETNATWELDEETLITKEEIASLTSLAIEKAYAIFQENNDTDMKFYCVGNSVIRYYMNGYQIGNLENHKAKSIGIDLIATFLPDDVVDGLYKAVELAGLSVANMTLEPIAAISVAIPEQYRMLNIALVDVGAGTSDICITKDGCIVAYGMISIAGDGLTEIIAKSCLVDFAMAEQIKRGISEREEVEYTDIMGLPQIIKKADVLAMLDEQIDTMTSEVSKKITELNGGKSVSAVFVVGGGGKIEGYTEKLASYLGIIPQRVALRGEEVMQKIKFKEETKKDSLLVTPIGICLNYYEQNNNFMYVTFNDERIKLYDNSSLAVVDAAMHAAFPNDRLFPRRGKEINYTINGVHKIVRGGLGEPAQIMLNGEETDLYHEIKPNDVIVVKESTAGADAVLTLDKIPELKENLRLVINKSKISLPRFPLVNGEVKSLLTAVNDGDKIVLLDYYTVKQVREFMDIQDSNDMKILVNNEPASDSTLCYDNFSISFIENEDDAEPVSETTEESSYASYEDLPEADEADDSISKEDAASAKEVIINENDSDAEAFVEKPLIAINVIANGQNVLFTGKSEYVFVDIFDKIDFDTKEVKGTKLVTNRNGKNCEYFETLADGDVLDIYWEK